MLVGCSGDSGASSPGPGGGLAGSGGIVGGSGGMSGLSGAGGASGDSAGGVGPSGGAGGAPPGAPSTLTEACIAYVTAQLARRDECSNAPQRPGHYLTVSAACPDILFSDGSARTIEGTNACTEEWRRFSCDSIDINLAPSCALPGKRAPGDACAYASQCDSSVCYLSGSCGTCMRGAGSGQSCVASDVTCLPGTTCTGGVCVELVAKPPPPPVTPMAAGAPCVRFSDCATDLYCHGDAQNVFTCQPYLVTGQPCTASGTVCRPTDYCDTSAGVCRALPGARESCTLTVPRTDCAEGLYCNANASGGATCVSLLLPGTACPATGAICHPGTTCQGGLCKPIDSQGLFAAACPAP